MTICEFFKNKFDSEINRERPVIKISDDVKPYSYEWIKLWSDNACGGTYEKPLLDSGITSKQIEEAKEKGFIKATEYANWEAKQRGRTHLYELTRKGLKEFYKYYIKA